MKRKCRGILEKLADIKLRDKLLLLYVVLLFIPIICTNALVFMRISDKVKEDNKEQISSYMEKTKNEFCRLIGSGMTLSHAIYNDNNLVDLMDKKYSNVEDYYTYYNKYLRDLLKKYLLTYDTIEDINVYSSNNTIPTADTYYKLDDEVRKTVWYKKLQAINNKMLVYSYIKADNMYAKRKVSIIRKLDNVAGGSENILKIDLTYKMITQIISDQNQNGEMYLVNEKNSIVYSTNKKYMSDDYAFSSYINLKLSPDEFKVEMDLGDISSLTGWKIVGVFREKGISSYLLSSLIFISLLSVICLASSSLVIIFISKSVNARIIKISRHMEKVKNQDFDLIDKKGGNDEIGQLMTDFNSMTLKIKMLIQEVYEADIQKKNLELERKQAELNALQSQINPHFLFNALESVRIKSLMKNETETADVVRCLSKTFRRMLVWGNDLITVKSEYEYIMDYLQIQKYRFSEKLSYEIVVPEDVMDYKIVKMAIQPFIENSCVHGIEGKSGSGKIGLTVERLEDRLIILIEDNGCGMDPEKLNQIRENVLSKDDYNGENIGVRNVCNRLKLFYGNEFQFSIESELNKGTKINMSLPVILQ